MSTTLILPILPTYLGFTTHTQFCCIKLSTSLFFSTSLSISLRVGIIAKSWYLHNAWQHRVIAQITFTESMTDSEFLKVKDAFHRLNYNISSYSLELMKVLVNHHKWVIMQIYMIPYFCFFVNQKRSTLTSAIYSSSKQPWKKSSKNPEFQ